MKKYFIGNYEFESGNSVEVLDIWDFENGKYEHVETIALEETEETDFPTYGVDPSNDIYSFLDIEKLDEGNNCYISGDLYFNFNDNRDFTTITREIEGFGGQEEIIFEF